MCTLAPARAQEVQIGLEQQLNAESNVFKNVENPFSDAFYRIRPSITLAQPETNFTYDFEYTPSFQAYFRANNINGFDHVARGRAAYQFNARDTVRFRGEYLNIRTIRADSILDVTGQPLVTRNDDGRSERLLGEVTLEHAFSARVRGTLGFRYDQWRYTTENNVNNSGVGGEAQLTYAFFDKLIMGANLDTRYREFEQVVFSPGSTSTVVNTNLIAVYELTPTVTLQASGGPAVVFTTQDLPAPQEVSRWAPRFSEATGQLVGSRFSTTECSTIDGFEILTRCPEVPFADASTFFNPFETTVVGLNPTQTLFGQSTTNTTYFVSIRILKRFPRGNVSASFVRNEDAGSGFGNVTILNSATARVVYSLDDVWRVSLTGVFTQREAASQLPQTAVQAGVSGQGIAGTPDFFAQAIAIVPNPIPFFSEQRISWIEANATRNLSENTFLRFQFRYYRQSQSRSTRQDDATLDNFLGAISFFYEFNSFKL